MKRNWTALALALGLTLTLTACGGNPGAAETPGSAAPTGSQTPAAESDLDYVKGNGVLKIGYTLFEPMNYLGEDGELTGFETEFATAVCAKLGVEAGSAGEAAVAADEVLSQASYTSVVKQTDALLEVKSGAADAAVMDFVLANTLAGTGDYSDLMVIPDLELSVEEYGIGFRQGSDLTAAVNQAMQELIDDGTLNELAVKYELADLLLANQ